jgi:undecaprenyl diphosphate synthase
MQRPPHPQVSARRVALISDGSRRWARARGLPVSAGHEAAVDTVLARTRDAIELGVEQLTIYSFSTENWTRAAEEVDGLFSLLARRIAADTPALHERGVRIRFIGASDGMPAELETEMRRAEQLTRANARMTVFAALNYGGRAEIVQAAKRFSDGSENDFRALLYAPELEDPDLIIRTGCEQRLSNFLLWQAAYAELVFRDELWPEFTRGAFEESLGQFSGRQRRFGGR